MLDAMSIRKQLVYDPHTKETVGFVNLGVGEEDDSEELASEALVIMLVGLRGRWKAPIAYFFTKGLSIETQSELVSHCMHKLTELQFEIHAITMDGHATNIGMCSKLGASMDIEYLRPRFHTPGSHNMVTHVLLDPCHMIKLLRNTLQHFGALKSPTGLVSWQHIAGLQELQTGLGLRLANKLTANHIGFEAQKMKVFNNANS